ncbi:spherulation-specific family 4 protein [Streptomyces sp. NPDC101165]|uniref:spherulation-specific family 4 protein n=1 Tax=Streptomyces sp. NPDC101165 TaxID=3366119 RepID=UPI00381714B7
MSYPASGPRDRPDAAFAATAARLRTAGVTLLGYSDTDYGRRPYEDVVRDLRRYREWYGTQGAFLDQVPSGMGESGHYERLTTAARTLGCVTLALNHGTPPHPVYAALADLLVTFEGPWATYLRTPPHYPAGVRVCHLVYGVPPDADMAGAARCPTAWAPTTRPSGPGTAPRARPSPPSPRGRRRRPR